MRRFTLAIAAAIVALGVTGASAADLGQRPVYKAMPAPVAIYNWSGFYIGGHLGYGWGREKITDNIKKLGVDVTSVRILLATNGGLGTAGGLAELQQATGAEIWASDASADVIASGAHYHADRVGLCQRTPHPGW